MDHRQRTADQMRVRADELGKTPGALADEIGASYQTVIRTLGGKSQPREKLYLWEDALELERGSLTRGYRYGEDLRPRDPSDAIPGAGMSDEELLNLTDEQFERLEAMVEQAMDDARERIYEHLRRARDGRRPSIVKPAPESGEERRRA